MLSAPALEIVRATDADISYVMATERTPGYEVFIGRWEHEQHTQALPMAVMRTSSVVAMAGRSASRSFGITRPSIA